MNLSRFLHLRLQGANPDTPVFNDKGGGQTVQTQQQSQPWDQVQPYLRDIFSRAQGLAGRGQNVAAQSPFTLQAIQRQAQSSLDPASLTNAGAGQFGKTIAGDYLTADSNPYLKGTVDRAMNDVMGRVNSTFGRGGGNNFGSSAHQEWLGRTLADTALPIYAANYQQERGRQLNAAQLAPGMEAAGNAPLTGAGGAQDAYQQSLLDSPWSSLQRYQQAISGAGGGQSTATQPYYPANPFMNALGMGIGGVGLYGMGKNAGLWGAGGSAGGLAGLGGMTGAADIGYGGGMVAGGELAGLSEMLPYLMLA